MLRLLLACEIGAIKDAGAMQVVPTDLRERCVPVYADLRKMQFGCRVFAVLA